VVETITDEKMEAMEKWWPGIHSSYALKFAVVELDIGTMDIVWTTQPCNYCDASGKASPRHCSVSSSELKRFISHLDDCKGLQHIWGLGPMTKLKCSCSQR